MAIPPHSFLSEPMLRLLLSFSSSPLSPACPPEGGNRLNWTNFETPSFLAILRDPAGDPHRAGRSGGVWQVRSCIAFSQTLHGPRGFPRDWVSKLRAFEHCRFSSFQTSCILHFPSLNQRDRASSSHCSRKAMMCAKPFESEIVHLQRGGFVCLVKVGTSRGG